MLTDASNNNESYQPSDFDVERLKSMDIGEQVISESKKWKVLRYKDEYVFISNDRKLPNWKEFKSFGDIIVFLSGVI